MDTAMSLVGECGESGGCIMASMIDDLKHCPFCGGDAVIKKINNGIIYVHCNRFKCDVSPCTKAFRDKEEAIATWNRRAEPMRPKGQWMGCFCECSICGRKVYYNANMNFCPSCGADMRGGTNE